MNKRGQGISINTIIVAAIALLVLVILSVVFTGRMGLWTKETASCEPNIGKCAPVTIECGTVGTDVADYPTPYRAGDCPDDRTCCTVGG